MDAVLNWLWQGCVVAAASFVMLAALTRARANVRYVVCWAALIVVAALPVLPPLHLSAISADAFGAPQDAALFALPDRWWTSALPLLAAWIVWGTAHVVTFVAAVAAIRRARAHSRPFPASEESHLPHWVGVRSTGRRATLVVSDAVTSAAVLGWGAPIIGLSPTLLETLDASELDRVLIHEWAHVQRRDDLVNIVQLAARAIVGWHPAIWCLDRRLHIEREMACDEVTVAITGSPKTYAECLMKVAGLRGTPRTLEAAPAVLTSSGLRARIVKIVSPAATIAPRWSRSIALAIVTCLCLMSMALGELKLVEARALAVPIVPPPALSARAHRVTPNAAPNPASDRGADRSVQTPSVWAVAQRPTMVQAVPQPNVESEASVARDARHAPEPTSSPLASSDRTAIGILPTVPQVLPERFDATAEKPPDRWTPAADGAAAIGRKSRDAGVATAGVFTSFGRRVAGTF